MRNRFLFALLGIIGLGVAAALVIEVTSRAPASAITTSGVSPQRAEVIPDVPPPSPVVTAPTVAPVAAPPVASVPLTGAPVTEPVRAAPASAPELAPRLESADPEERNEAMLELRQHRQTSTMQWLNRRRDR
jgi:hypothetical protein